MTSVVSRAGSAPCQCSSIVKSGPADSATSRHRRDMTTVGEKCLIVQIIDANIKIGIQGIFDISILERSEPTLTFAHEGLNLKSKMTDIENVTFSYNFQYTVTYP